MESILLGNKQGDLQYFDDSLQVQQHQPYKISTIKIYSTQQGIFGIQLYYYSFNNQSIIKCKEHKPQKLFGVTENKLILDSTEYIIQLTWYQNELGINRLEIQTNKQQLNVGQKDGEKCEYKVEENTQLGALSGGYKTSLQFLEWQILPLNEQQTQYQSQLYQMYISQSDQIVTNQKFEYIGKSYKVCDPQIIESGLATKYVQFRIIDNSEQEIVRRFSDIYQLRAILVLRWPGVYVPPLMQKQTLEDYSSDHIEVMRKSMEYFLMKLSKIPYFAQSIEFNVFITKTNKNNQQEMEYVQNKLSQMTQQTNLEQINLRYKQTFEEFETKESVNEQQRQKCNDFTLLMQRLELLKIGDFQEIKRLFETHTKNVNYLSKYVLPELHFMHIQQEEAQQQQQQRRKSSSVGFQMQMDTMNDVYDYFVTEQREAAVMTQCMTYIKDMELQKGKLEQKILNGKLKEEELNNLRQQFSALSSIWSILVKAYATYFIDTYFKERYQLYLFMINRLAQIQLNNLKIRQNFWLSI